MNGGRIGLEKKLIAVISSVKILQLNASREGISSGLLRSEEAYVLSHLARDS
jgi:hypothetical protein